MHFKLFLKPGQALVEILLAIVLSSVALVGMAQIATKSLGNTGASRSRSEANKFAVEAIEWVRDNRRQMDWVSFAALNNTKCANTNLTTAVCLTNRPGCSATLPDSACASNAVISGTVYTRNLIFTPSANTQTVTVTASWNEKGVVSNSTQTIVFKQY